MHEWKITESVVEEVLLQAKKNELKKIEKVTLSMGEDVDLTPEAIEFCFKCLGKDTILNDVHLEINKSKGRGITVESIEGER